MHHHKPAHFGISKGLTMSVLEASNSTGLPTDAGQIDIELRSLVDAGVLVVNSVLMAEAQLVATSVKLPVAPVLPPPDALDARMSALRAAVTTLSVDLNVNHLNNIARTLAELQFALDGVFVAFGLGAAKPLLLNEVHTFRMTPPDSLGHYRIPDINGVLALASSASGPPSEPDTEARRVMAGVMAKRHMPRPRTIETRIGDDIRTAKVIV